jgi:hypothetical protein
VARLVLRTDSVAYLVVGLVLLAAPWDGLWDALDLPQARPELWTQLAGALLLGLAYLLWIAPRDGGLTHAAAATGAVVNALATLILGAWLLGGDLDSGTLGKTLLWLTALATAVYAVAEFSIASRRLPPLLPLD